MNDLISKKGSTEIMFKKIMHEVNIMKKLKISFFIIFLLVSMFFFTSDNFAATYKYDDLNRLVEAVYDDGTIVRYTYDGAGNILEVEVINLPKLDPIGNKTVKAGQLLKFTVTVSGSEGLTPVLAAYNLPEGAKFDVETGVFAWVPASEQTGVYEGIRFEAVVGEVVLFEEITITVTGTNTPAGQNVEVVDEESGAAITFENVETQGTTTVTVHNSLPEGILSGANMFPVYYDIETDAGFTGKARIKINMI